MTLHLYNCGVGKFAIINGIVSIMIVQKTVPIEFAKHILDIFKRPIRKKRGVDRLCRAKFFGSSSRNMVISTYEIFLIHVIQNSFGFLCKHEVSPFL